MSTKVETDRQLDVHDDVDDDDAKVNKTWQS